MGFLCSDDGLLDGYPHSSKGDTEAVWSSHTSVHHFPRHLRNTCAGRHRRRNQVCVSGARLKDHGAISSPSLPERALDAARTPLALPESTKRTCFKKDHIWGGYEPFKALNVDPSNEKRHGLNEGFSIASHYHPTTIPPPGQRNRRCLAFGTYSMSIIML
jgi:hypothetical protein